MSIFSQYTSKILIEEFEKTVFCAALTRFTYFCKLKRTN